MKIKIFILSVCIWTTLLFSAGTHAAFSDIFDDETPIGICADGECGLEKGIESLKNVNDLETERPASEYIQDVVEYLLTFLWLLAVIYIMYGWFLVFSSAGDDEQVSKGKKLIIYALVGILVIFLAYSIVLWFIGVVNW